MLYFTQIWSSDSGSAPAAPGSVRGPLEVTKQSGDRVLLEWGSVPQGTGMDRISSLVIEKKEGSSGRWVVIANVSPNKRAHMVERVAGDVATTYRVSAENYYGKGQPVEGSASRFFSTPRMCASRAIC